MISIAIPYYTMEDHLYFIHRCLKSIEMQTYKDYEIVITENTGGWSANHNEAISKCKGDIIKFLHMDDMLSHENSLQVIADNFKGGWLVTGCTHTHGKDRFNEHLPEWTDDIVTGNNRMGAPSVLAIENKDPLLFSDNMSWVVDCDYYQRLYNRYGAPTIVNDINVVIGIHKGQATNLLSDEVKQLEVTLLKNQYDII